MGKYLDREGGVKRPSPKSNEADSWVPRRFAIAARLEALGQLKKAWRLRNCGRRKEGGYPCKRPQLCDYCRLVRTLTVKLDYTARALHAARESPTTMLFWATFTLGEANEFDDQARRLRAQLRSMPRRSPSWRKVDGCLWFLEPAKGAGGRWRTHLHCILAVDLRDPPKHPRTLVLAWARAAWKLLHPSEPVPASRKSERAFRRFVLSQDIRPLHCYSQSPLLTPRVPSYSTSELAQDVARLCEYVGMRKDHRPSTRGHRRVCMTADDHIEVDTSRRHFRGCSGKFRAAPKNASEHLIGALRSRSTPITAEDSRPVRGRREP